jgi:TolB protein
MLLFLMRKAFTLMFPVLLLTVLTVGLVFPALATKGSYPGINGKIAFYDRESSPDDDEIFVMDNDGTNIEQLTFNDVYDRDPCWSPDGTKITFRSEDGSDVEIWVIDADGSNLRQLTTPPDGYTDSDPAWSPDGSKIAFTRQHTSSPFSSMIYVIDANGPAGPGTLLIDVTNARHPSWSPDGSEISYNSNGVIYVADASTGTLKRTLGNGEESCWSPDGSKIVFVVDSVIWVMDAADGSNRKQLSNPPVDYYDNEPNWSPDGNKIIFQRELDSIWIMDADGSNEYDLTPTRPIARAPDYQRIPLTPVGGVASPVNKLELIAPYLALAGLIVAVSTIFVIKRRKA